MGASPSAQSALETISAFSNEPGLGGGYLLGRKPTDGNAPPAGEQTGGLGEQTGGLPAENGEAPQDADRLSASIPLALQVSIAALGGKPTPTALRRVIVELCELRWWTPRELALVLSRKDPAHLSEKHLAPLVREGALERRYPDKPAHPHQAYRARQAALPTEEDEAREGGASQ